MKRRVRIYKAQLGGVQALQEQQAQLQNKANDEAILASIVAKLDQEDEGVAPEDILRDLMNAGMEQAKAAQLIRTAMAAKEERDALSQAESEDDQDAIDDLQADQDVLTAQAEEEDKQDAILAQMYESSNYDEGYDDENQFFQDNILESAQEEPQMQRRGGTPNKRAFVKKASSVLKAQMGQEMQPSKADSTDTGARQMMMSSFLKTVQDTGNNALIKKDAEQAYDMTSMYPMSDSNTPEAQFGANMSRGQQRRFNRRLNRAIGNIPIPTNGLMPSGFVTYPTLQGSGQEYMPSEGSYYGGPRLANIDVHRTGLFGRPKEYTITFANEALYNPTLRKQVIKQEARNRKVLTEDEVDELLKKEEEITGKKSETPKAEEEKEAEGRKDISSNSSSSRSNTSTVRRNTQQTQPVVEEEEETVAQQPAVQTAAPWEAALQQSQAQNKPEWLETHPNYPEGPVEAKSSYSSGATPEDLYYYNPDKPGYSYLYKNNKLYYDDASNSDQDWHEIKDPSRISELNQKLRGADIFTLPGKEGFYYRQRPDGSYAKFQGDPAKHTSSTKQVAVIKPGTSNYDYLNKNKQYSYSFSGKKMQMGGFTDEASGLSKFVYGGNEFVLPETGGKLVNSPYFEEGGSYMQEGGPQESNLFYNQYLKDLQDPENFSPESARIAYDRRNDYYQDYLDRKAKGVSEVDNIRAFNSNAKCIADECDLKIPTYEELNRPQVQFTAPIQQPASPEFVVQPSAVPQIPSAQRRYAYDRKTLKNILGIEPRTGHWVESTTPSDLSMVNKKYGGLPKAQTGKIVKAYKNGKFVGYMNQETADKYGLDWNTANDYESDTDTDEDYNTNPQTVFPGGYAKQKGLPYDPSTGETYYGGFSPYGQVDKIDVTKTRLLSGAPKRYTMYYTDYFPTDGGMNKPVTDTTNKTLDNNAPAETFEDNKNFGSRLRDFGYKLMPKGMDVSNEPKLRNWIDQKRSEKMGVQFPEIKAYGGDMDYAQTGENYPYMLDPRFYPDVLSDDELDSVVKEAGNLDTTKSDDTPIEFDDVLKMKEYVRSQVNKEGIDPRTFGSKEIVDPILADKKQRAVDFKVRRTNEENLNNLFGFNTFVNAGLNKTGERGNAQREAQLRNRYLADNLYGSRGKYDRGTYEVNSGLYKPDEMGFTGVVKEGGAIYKEGGTHYMSAAQVKKFLEEGGELEFV